MFVETFLVPQTIKTSVLHSLLSLDGKRDLLMESCMEMTARYTDVGKQTLYDGIGPPG